MPPAPKVAMAAGIVKSDDASWVFENRDALSYLDRATPFPARTLIYCDPPYVLSTRKGGKIYRHELDDVDHRRFLRWCRSPKHGAMVMVSGYWSQMYADALEGWNSIRFESMTRGGTTATGWLWFNFPAPVELHDYRYLGKDFRERERIKRKKQRWTARLARMPMLERQALYAAMAVHSQA